MSSKSKQFLASLFGIRINEEPPQLQSLVPARVSSEIKSGVLPRFNPNTIMLGKNEICHFMDRAALVVKKTEKSYQSRRTTGSYKVTRNYSVHTGGGMIKPVEQTWYEYKEGILFITNERIVFVSQENGFEKKVKNLTAVIPYNDAIALQFGNQTVTIVLPQPLLAAMVIKMMY